MYFIKPLNYLLFLLIFSVSFETLSQSYINEEVSDIHSVDLLKLPPLDNKSLVRKNAKNDVNVFAEARAIAVNPKQNGTWESTKSGLSVWRQRIKSPMAFSLNLGFTEFKLEAEVSLFIYNMDKTEIFGPFTQKDNDQHLQLWTPMVSGDEIVIEVQGPLDKIEKSKILISSVNHDFVDLKTKMLSGSCNIDVVCSEADGFGIIDNYRDIISSVGAYTLNGINQCSGMLINNTAKDCKPYFITADHCDITTSNASSVVVYWNYENQTCRQPNSVASGLPGNGRRTQFNSGSILRANSIFSDFALIEMDDPIDPTLNLYFAGWDLSGELTDTSICIHHPNVEEKRISFDFDRTVYESGNDLTEFIRVLDWDMGTTEPGSSGAPIFNSRKQFIGQLNGGFAACGNNEYDRFGYINYAWDRNASSTNSLKSWLDPLGFEVQSLQGIFCGLNLQLSQTQFNVCKSKPDEVVVDILPSIFFDLNLDYDIVDSPEGLTVTFKNESGLGSELNSVIINGFENLESGDYTIIISADDGINIIDATITFSLFDEIPNIPRLKEPIDNSDDILFETTLKISRSSATQNVFQVSTDPNFSNIIFDEITQFVLIDVSNLSPGTLYYWRASSINVCGETEWSEVFSFKTASSFCTFLTSSNEALTIDEDIETTVNSEISINYPIRLQDVNVQNVKGTHTYIEDLAFKLTFNQNEVLLATELCGNFDDFNFGFDDESENFQIDCPPIEGKLYTSVESLEIFNGMLAGGIWTLSIDDMVRNDGGLFEEWTVKVCFDESDLPAIIPEYHKYNYCENQLLTINAYYNSKDIDNFDLVVFDEEAQNVLNSYTITSDKENQLSLDINTQLLLGPEHNLQIGLRNKENLEIIAISMIDLVNSGSEKIINITSPVNNEILPFDGFNIITWSDDFEGTTLVELSTDIQFGNIVYSQNVLNDNSLDVSGLSFLPGAYYLRVRKQFDCGLVPSQVISFSIDESNGIEETGLFQIDIYPNPAKNLIYIKNEVEFEQRTLVQLFDLTGRYFEPKLQFVSSHLVVLDLSQYNEGLYIVKIKKEGNTFEKLIFKSN